MTTRKQEHSYRTLAMGILLQVIDAKAKQGIATMDNVDKLSGDERNALFHGVAKKKAVECVNLVNAVEWLRSLPQEGCPDVQDAAELSDISLYNRLGDVLATIATVNAQERSKENIK